jgi:hypothetical protein
MDVRRGNHHSLQYYQKKKQERLEKEKIENPAKYLERKKDT